MALVAVAIVSIIAMAGLSIDIGTLYQASAEAQRAADAAALAAARVISMQGVTGDPLNGLPQGTVSWAFICGGAASPASAAAITVAQQNPVGGTPASLITVNYLVSSGGTPNADCSTFGSSFGVNPMVTVQVKQANLPTFFARIWGQSGSSVSATATAEAFNPSNSAAYGTQGQMVPVQPRCVKPWIVPNFDPLHQLNCNTKLNTTQCSKFIDPTTGSIITPGILVNGAGIIGERFFLQADCQPGLGTCSLLNGQPQANTPAANALQYVPGQTSNPSIAVPSDGSSACSAVAGNYAQAIAGCDQTTQYQCGVQSGSNFVDLSENPVITPMGDMQNGSQCLIHQGLTTTSNPSGQDVLAPGGPAPPSYPFQIQAGTSNANTTLPSGGFITSSTSIVSLPIYDSDNNVIAATGLTNVTIIGFLQVFINAADPVNGVDVTVLNVSGCGNGVSTGTAALQGTSSVPVRLVTPPTP